MTCDHPCWTLGAYLRWRNVNDSYQTVPTDHLLPLVIRFHRFILLFQLDNARIKWAKMGWGVWWKTGEMMKNDCRHWRTHLLKKNKNTQWWILRRNTKKKLLNWIILPNKQNAKRYFLSFFYCWQNHFLCWQNNQLPLKESFFPLGVILFSTHHRPAALLPSANQTTVQWLFFQSAQCLALTSCRHFLCRPPAISSNNNTSELSHQFIRSN